MTIYPETLLDGYKIGHRVQYAPGTDLVFSNLTPRRSYRAVKPEGVVWLGLQYFVKEYLIKQWKTRFFDCPVEEVRARFNELMGAYLGPDNNVGDAHLLQLHALGYLPLEIRALKEGTIVPYGVAPMVGYSTDKRFYWLTNYVETIWSTTVWPISTAATTAKQFRDLLDHWAMKTVGSTDFVKWMGHNFSYRGCMGHEAGVMVDCGHASSFAGSDTVPGIPFLREYYNATGLITGSVNATEHSVMCSYGHEREQELDAYRHLITKVYPKGIASIVSDTNDYWQVINEFARELKDVILAREGKIVFRPDSGDNVDIIIGDPNAPEGSPEHKGTIEVLWDIFGGTINALGYRELNPKVGAILGDGVNLNVAAAICEGLAAKGFASTNIVFGIGSFCYVYNISRDTDGWAVKSTYCENDGTPREIFKAPKTDKDGFKKSARGLIAVYRDADGKLYQKDRASWEEVKNCEYDLVLRNGVLHRDEVFADIRLRINPRF